jgi:hypothetical protein
VHENMDFAANTHIISHAGRILATVEAGPLPYELSDELETLGPCDFGGTLPGGFAAHTKLDQRTGELHAIAYFWAWDYVQHVVIDAAGQVSRTTDIPVADGSDDARLRAHREPTSSCSTCRSRSAWTRSPPGKELPYVWNPAHQARVGLLPATATRMTSAGSKSTPVLSSTRSTGTRTAAGSSSTCASTRLPTTLPP